jgi:hypothetical protein
MRRGTRRRPKVANAQKNDKNPARRVITPSGASFESSAWGRSLEKPARFCISASGNDERALVVCVRQTPARMEPATQAHDVLAATLIALVSIFAFVLGVSGLKRRARKFAKNAPSKAR